jgi:hypothetical protein
MDAEIPPMAVAISGDVRTAVVVVLLVVALCLIVAVRVSLSRRSAAEPPGPPEAPTLGAIPLIPPEMLDLSALVDAEEDAGAGVDPAPDGDGPARVADPG